MERLWPSPCSRSPCANGRRERQARDQFRTAAGLRSAQRKTETALAELQEAKTNLIQAEKLAALGQLVAGVAHEVTTPIGMALTTSTTMEAAIGRLVTSVESGRVLRSELDRSSKRLAEGCRLLTANLHRAASLIGSFKQVAIDHEGSGHRRFRIGEIVRSVIRTLARKLHQHGHEVTIECPTDLEVDSQPDAVFQIVSNLLSNAATHAYPAGRKKVGLL